MSNKIGRTNSSYGSVVPNPNLGDRVVFNIIAETGSTISFAIYNYHFKDLPPSKGKPSVKYPGYSEWLYVFTSSQAYAGEWTITASKGNQTYSEVLTISTPGQYDVMLLYDLYLIKDGLFNTDYTHTFYGGSNSSLTEDPNGYVYLYSANKSSTYATCSISDVDPTYYKYLVFDGCGRGYYATGRCPAFGILNSTASGGSYSTWKAVTMIRASKQSAFDERGIKYLDISSYQYMNVMIGIQEAGTATSPAVYGGIQCYNLYLSNTLPA